MIYDAREVRTLGALIVALTTLTCSTGPKARADASVSDSSEVDPSEDLEIPCQPRQALAVCQNCHSRPPKRGTPFPLVHRADILATEPSSGRVIRELMIEQLEVRRMPLAPVALDDEGRRVLIEWLRAGAPAVPPQHCSDLDGGVADTGAADAATDDAELPTDAAATDATDPTDATDATDAELPTDADPPTDAEPPLG